MTRILINIIVSLLIISLPRLASAQEPENPRTMKFAPLNFSIPKVERVLLSNGTPVYLLNDAELPIVSIYAMIRTGSVYDPPAKTGLASLTGMMLRNGGSSLMEPARLDDELEFMASSIESGFSADNGSLSMTCLVKNLQPTMEMFADVMLRPRFDQARLEVSKRQMIEAIRRRNDDPKTAADNQLLKALYPGHPLGAEPDKKTVEAISREDLIDFHKRFVRPDNMIIGVAGNFDRATMIEQLNRLIGSVKPDTPLLLPEIPQPDPVFSAEILYAPKQVNQSVIRMGHSGITKDSPDLYAIRLLDFILGGSFTSRLVMEIRTNQGLAYNVGSHFDIGRRFTGTFTAETETKSGATVKTISLMQSIINGIRNAPVTDEELALAKESIINSFLFAFTTPSSIVIQKMRMEFYGYQPDYLEKYRERIGGVTSGEILEAARRHLHPDKLKIVVIGDEKGFDKPLSGLGAVRKIELN